MMNNPCYDRKTKTDCPRRKAGCSVDCPDWAKYIQEREKTYKAREINQEMVTGGYDIRHKRVTTRNKRYIYDRTGRR